MNIVITGNSSLIGNNLAEYFHSKGNNVTVIGRKKEPFSKSKGIRYAKFDWNNPEAFFNSEKEIDIFIHSASLNAQECKINSEEAFNFNSFKSELLAQLCIKKNVKLFIYFSTIHIYTPNPTGCINEDFPPQNKHPYAESKFYAERLIQKTAHKNNMKFLILRLSNIIASPFSLRTKCWDLIAPNLCKQIAQEKKIFLKSSPDTLRDFVGMNQLNKFIKFYIDNLENFKSDLFNFTSSKTMTIFSLAEKLKLINERIFNESIDILFDSKTKKNNVEPFLYSNKKVSSLGFKIDKTIDDELESTLMFCKLNFDCSRTNEKF